MIKRLLRSYVIWRLTGLTYATAIIATHGKYVAKDKYLREGKREMSIFSPYFNSQSSVIEFGCGPGKNLFGIADKIKLGYGIDVNPLYIRIANRLRKHSHINNIKFISYDGNHFPQIPKADIVFEKGVFERIPESQVKKYINELKYNYLSDNGIMILYFLMDRAKRSKFTKKLGDDAYIFWNDLQINQLLEQCNLYTISIINGEFADFYVCKSKQNC